MAFATEREPSFGVPLNVRGQRVSETIEQLGQHYEALQDQMKAAKQAGNKKEYRGLLCELNRANGALAAFYWVRGDNGAFQI